MKRTVLWAMLMAIGILGAGCGDRQADQPAATPESAPASVPDTSHVEGTDVEQTPAAQPSEIMEEPVAPPDADATEDARPSVEGPAFPEPSAAAVPTPGEN